MFEVSDLFRRERVLLFRRHPLDVRLALDGLDQPAVGGFAGNEWGATVAAFAHAVRSVEQQAAADLVGAGRVTGVALLGEDGADVFLEVVDAVARRFGGAR